MPHYSKEKAPSKPERMKPSIYFDFKTEDKPDGYADVHVGDAVMVLVRGTVQGMHENRASCGLSIEYDELELVGNAKPKSMQDALAAAQRRK